MLQSQCIKMWYLQRKLMANYTFKPIDFEKPKRKVTQIYGLTVCQGKGASFLLFEHPKKGRKFTLLQPKGYMLKVLTGIFPMAFMSFKHMLKGKLLKQECTAGWRGLRLIPILFLVYICLYNEHVCDKYISLFINEGNNWHQY